MSTVAPLPEPGDLTASRAVAALAAGDLVVLACDVGYVVVADSMQRSASRAIHRAKGHRPGTPVGVLADSLEEVDRLAGGLPEVARTLGGRLWPGPLTLLVDVAEDPGWHLGRTRDTAAVRVPDDELLRWLVDQVGPLACSRAQRADAPAARTVEEARTALGDRVALYLDDGEREVLTTTVVDVTVEPAEVRRPGAIDAGTVAQLVRVREAADDEPVGADAGPDAGDDGPTGADAGPDAGDDGPTGADDEPTGADAGPDAGDDGPVAADEGGVAAGGRDGGEDDEGA